MRQARILFRNEEAALLIQHDGGSFTFRYLETWLLDGDKPAISLSFPKSEKEFHSPHLFPFFYNMLPEGTNKQIVCKLNRIDPDDDLGLLMTTAHTDPIGAVRVIKIEP